MLKDVGMTGQKVEKQEQYICSNTGDEGMQQYNNNMRNTSLHFTFQQHP